MTNEEIIVEAVEAFRLDFVQAAVEGESQEQLVEKVPTRDPEWRHPGVRLIFRDPKEYEVVLRPEGEDGADIEVLGPGGVRRAHRVERGYASVDEPVEKLRRRIEVVWQEGSRSD